MNHTQPLDNPALVGKRYHEMAEHAHMRRSTIKNYLILALVVINAWSIYGNVRASGTARYIPYPIEVREDGAVRKVGVSDPLWKPTDMMIRKEIRTFILATRGRYDSPKLTRDFWQNAGLHTKGKGRTLLMQTYTDTKPHLFKGTVDVSISHVLFLSGTSYNARWTETKRTEQGGMDTVTHWSGIFTISLELPTLLNEVEANPTGVWIDNWSITSEEN